MQTKEAFIDYIKNFRLGEEKNEIGIFDREKNWTENNTIVKEEKIEDYKVNKYINEFWTSKQRQANSIHEISYRACFKPQLPKFFIKHLTQEGDFIYDPFLGRGTTVIEGALMGRQVIGNDVNPLSKILSQPRLQIPSLLRLKKYLQGIPVDYEQKANRDLSMFYHPKTESEIVSLKEYILNRVAKDKLNKLDQWIRMVATNRLTGHSKGFFSVYTMPPNQAVTPKSQRRINKKRGQSPEYRNVKARIIKKSSSLIRDITPHHRKTLKKVDKSALFLNEDARKTRDIPDNTVQLTVSSPPFLDVVQYARDNWLRCWFNGLDAEAIEKNITMSKSVEKWSEIMQSVFNELHRITKFGGYIAFEVGEVRKGKINLDEYIVPIGIEAGFNPLGILINQQEFTKTSNIWGVKNNTKGTNSNRIAIFRKD